MTEEEFYIKNPCIYKVINGERLNRDDILKQSEFLKTHTFAFKFLPESYSRVLKVRYGLIDGNVYTLRQVAKMFDVSYERISQLEHEAFKKLVQEQYLDILMHFDDSTFDQDIFYELEGFPDYKRLMFQDVKKAILEGQIGVKDNLDISMLRLANISNYQSKMTKTKLLENNINTISNLLIYLYQKKNLKDLDINVNTKTYKSLILAIMRLIEEKKLFINSQKIRDSYEYNRESYLEILKNTNQLDVYLFPEHSLLMLEQERAMMVQKAVKTIFTCRQKTEKRLIQQKIERENAINKIETKLGHKLEDISLDTLNLSLRTYNALRRAGIHSVAHIINHYLENKTLKNIKCIGNVGVNEVIAKLAELNIILNADDGQLIDIIN